MILHSAIIESPLGTLKIEGDDNGISAVCKSENEIVSAAIPKELENAVLQLTDYFLGKRKTFNLKLNPKGTVFQQKVWAELQKIPFGKTTSYLDLAKKLGDPKVIRAAAAANGKNPILILIPCHRVIGSDGSLTGFSAGLWRKKWLLEHENPNHQKELFD